MTGLMGIAVPLAHVGHWWTYILYAVPVVIVLGAVVRTLVQQRREGTAGDGSAGAQAEPADDERG